MGRILSRQPGNAAGFTLIELMIGVTINILVMSAVGAAIVGMQRAYQTETTIRSATEASRSVSQLLERELRMAGYGIHPVHAFDMAGTGLADPTKDNYAGSGFTTDDLAFRYRDPAYLRRGYLNSGGSTLTLAVSPGGSSLGIDLPAQTALLLACPGAREWAIYRTGGAATAGAGSVGVAIDGSLANPETGAAANPACLQESANPAFVMLVREVRLRIQDFDGRPYLVRFTNLRTPDPAINDQFDPIAADVEDFQVAYAMNRPTTTSSCCAALAAIDGGGNANWVLADAAAEALPSIQVFRPRYSLRYDDPLRFTADPGNVRGVRMTAVVRSASRSRNGIVSAPVSLENHVLAAAAADGFYRSLVTMSIRTPNLQSKSFFIPPLMQSGDVVQNDTSSTGETLPRDTLNNWGA